MPRKGSSMLSYTKVATGAAVLALMGLASAHGPATGAGIAAGLATSIVTGVSVPAAGEARLENIRQLTFGGENAEAYFAFDGDRLIFQATPRGEGCDQIFTMNLDGSDVRQVSTGEGRTTCSYYYPSGDKILYSSTHHFNAACPSPPDFSRGYVWAIYPSYDIFVSNADGSDLQQLTYSFGYDAEATFSPLGDLVVFTSMRDGDLEIYTMKPDGSDVRRITRKLGYDGGAFFSPDGSKIIYRAYHPESAEDVADYRALLAEGLIRPNTLEIFVMDADGSNPIQLTDKGVASFAPYWHPSGEKVIFSSNMDDPTGRDFDLYMIDIDGTGLERITTAAGFDGFPVFSPDGRYLVWGSNRGQEFDGETNIFIAEWVERP
jgi:TolB protein